MENLRKYKIAVVQMDSRNDKGANLKYAASALMRQQQTARSSSAFRRL